MLEILVKVTVSYAAQSCDFNERPYSKVLKIHIKGPGKSWKTSFSVLYASEI